MTIELNREDATALCAMIQDADETLYRALGSDTMENILCAANIDQVKDLLMQTLSLRADEES